ncbi:MAG: tRNA (adenosine(37)-N6)-threonylcarbamoyltransferase complex dimerization subunit type 1 TsaB [Clostridia bacterium]|nr:tRNA (adenosine(37)-N6)-threonylcarbamoyltransferase complex dimerization subunit type 1 TsaB [Clostridia bacterium]
MSNFLGIDTSSRYLTVLAVKGNKVAVRHLPDCAMQHSVVLMDEIDRAFKEADLNPNECDFFCAVTGPGSFTGIRIGISAVKGFAVGADKPMLCLTSFDLIAYNIKDKKFYTVIDAMHGSYYVCGYSDGGEIILPPSYMSGEQVKSLCAPLYGFEDLPLEGYTKVDIKDNFYPAVCANQDKLSEDICALYVRKSQAEEGRK